MIHDLRQFSFTKIGQTWTSEDHQFLLTALERVDQTCIAVWEKIRAERLTAPKRVDELLSLDPPPSKIPDAPCKDLTRDPEF
jgi:hypothetical protein